MPGWLRNLTLRARLLIVGGAAIIAVLVLTFVSLSLMAGFESKSDVNSASEKQAQLVSHAYESWIYNDDQNNMYAAIIALRDPSQQKLAETTWGQAVSGYQGAVADLAKLHKLVNDPSMLATLKSIDGSLASYNGFSQQIRTAGLAGDPRKAVYVATVANLTPSNALPVEFTKLRDAIERHETQAAKSVHSTAARGKTIILLVAAIALPLLLLLVITTIRSIMSGVKYLRRRVEALSRAMVENLEPGLRAFADGDFTVRLSAKTQADAITRHDELGQIMETTEQMRSAILDCYEAYNQSTEQLRGVIAQVSSTATSVDGASQQMATSS